MNIKKQLRRFYSFGFFSCLRLPDAVWVVLLVARGFSLWQIGVAEAVYHVVSILCEIPSGVVADLVGRRRSLAAAGVCGLLSALLMAFSTQFLGVCISMAFSALSCSFISGSDEALLYDSLLEAGKEKEYITVNARYSKIQSLGSVLSNAGSLLTGVFSHICFYLTDAMVCIIRVINALSLKETSVTKKQTDRQDRPFHNFGSRLYGHVKEVFVFLRTYPKALCVMLADGLLTLPSFLTLMFLQQRLSLLGLDPMWLGFPIMCISFFRVVGVMLGQRLRIKNLRKFYMFCALTVGVGTVCAGIAPIIPAVVGAMVSAASIDAWMLHLQNYLNRLFPSDSRATLISVNMMAYSLLMILASPVVGWLSGIGAGGGLGLCVLGLVIVIAGVTLPFVKRRTR